MASAQAAQRSILASTSLAGGATAITILLGVVRLKLVALLLGPVGVGLIGLFQNFISSSGMVSGLGISGAAVREIAVERGREDEAAVRAIRTAYCVGTIAFATLAACLLLLFGAPLVRYAVGEQVPPDALSWLAAGLFLTAVSAIPLTLLNAEREIGRLSLAQVLGAVAGTMLGLAALYAWHERGLLAYVVAAPLALTLAAYLLGRRYPLAPIHLALLRQVLPKLVRLGVPMVIGAASIGLATLQIRAAIGTSTSLETLGLFSASWTISTMYVALLTTAMSTDYFPRLAGQIGRGEAIGTAIAEQMEMALLLALPMLLIVAATAPLLLHILYSEAFVAAGALLRLQALGDAFKLLSFPAAYWLLAAGRGKTYMLVEVLTAATLVGFALIFIPRFGLEGAGIAYVLTMAAYFLVLQLMLRRRVEFRVTVALLLTGGTGLAMLVLTIWAASISPLWGAVIGLPLATIAGYRVLRRLADVGMLPVFKRP